MCSLKTLPHSFSDGVINGYRKKNANGKKKKQKKTSVSATLIAYQVKTIKDFGFVAARFPKAFRTRHALKSKEIREEPAVDLET